MIWLSLFAFEKFTGLNLHYTVKKCYRFSRPQPGCHLPNSPWTGIIKFFPSRESLVSDMPAGEGKITNLFLQCILVALKITSSFIAFTPPMLVIKLIMHIKQEHLSIFLRQWVVTVNQRTSTRWHFIYAKFFPPGGHNSQRDVVYLGWPIAPYAPKCGGWKGKGVVGSQVPANEYSSAYRAQINFGDLRRYLT